jgi:hypothetical protein
VKNGPYEMVMAPEEYPGKRYRGRYCYEHHLVYWRAYGILPKRGEVVHHKNEQKRDNRIENLEIKTVGQHNSDHAAARPRTEIHGLGGYTHRKCRCDVCRTVWNRRNIAYKRRQAAPLGADPN